MTIVFETGTVSHAGATNALRVDLAVGSPNDMPPVAISPGHQVMAIAYALAALGIYIGHGPGEAAPEDVLKALKDGLVKTKPDASRDLRERLAAIHTNAVSS